MKNYKNFDTGEIWSEDEVREIYEQFKWEMYPDGDFPDFKEYLEEELAQGRAKTGGLVEYEPIRELRTMTGLTQKAFAEKYHIPKRTLENWEGGQREPSETILYLLERAVREDFKMTYVIIDDCTSKAATVWDTKFQSKEEAIKEAESEWGALTRHDKARRDAYYVAVCKLDEDGEIDWDTVESIITYK